MEHQHTGGDADDWRVIYGPSGGLPPQGSWCQVGRALRVGVFAEKLGDPCPAHGHLVELLHERKVGGDFGLLEQACRVGYGGVGCHQVSPLCRCCALARRAPARRLHWACASPQ